MNVLEDADVLISCLPDEHFTRKFLGYKEFR